MTLVRGYILFFTLITQHTPVTAFSPLTDEVNNIILLVIMQCSVEQPWNMASITDAYGTTHKVIRQARLLTVVLPFGCSLPQQYTAWQTHTDLASRVPRSQEYQALVACNEKSTIH